MSPTVSHIPKPTPALLLLQRLKMSKSLTWQEIMGNGILAEQGLRFAINFNTKFFESIATAEILEGMGFELPDTIRFAALQKNNIFLNIVLINKMLTECNNIVQKLSVPQLNFLRDHIREVELNIQPGLSRIIWASLGIPEYTNSCRLKIQNLHSLYEQMVHVRKDIKQKIYAIQKFDLFPFTPIKGKLKPLPCKQFFTEMETLRTEVVCQMVKLYEMVGPILMKLESIVTHTSTGRAPSMHMCYSDWENKIFKTLVRMVLNNLEKFYKYFTDRVLMFQIDGVLVLPELQLWPSATDTFNIILKDVKDFLSRLKSFRRWMNKTCILCEPQRNPNTEEYYTFSFYDEVLQVSAINEIITKMQTSIQANLLEVHKNLQKWKRYRNLWSFDKSLVCERFLAKFTQLHKIDDKFSFYDNIILEMKENKDYCNLGSIRLNLRPLFDSICLHAVEWKVVLGQQLAALIKEKMTTLKETMDELRVIVNKNIKGLELFKAIMQAITTILRMNISVELEYKYYQEIYNILEQHGLYFDPLDKKMAYDLQEEWNSLYFSALYRGKN